MIKNIYKYVVLALSVVVFGACDDGDSFSVSPANVLTFSADTIRFDTVFSTVPTSTRSFWVYNKSGDGLRMTDVRLEQGNQSGYRVNVDGAYLSPEQGYRVNDIEIRDKDSIRVFVELTSTSNFSDTPKELNDNLVFNLESGRQQKIVLNAWSWDALVIRNCEVSSDSVLSSNKPIVIYGKLKVNEGATLTIAPGTTIYFHGDAGIDVEGRLVCKGTPEANITFRGDRLDKMFDYLPYDRVSGQWQGIHILEKSYDNELEYTDLHSAFDGIVVDSSDVSRNSLTITNSTLHNNQGYGLRVVNSKVKIVNCQITNTLEHCLAVDGGDVDVNNSTIAQFYPFDSSRQSAIFFSGYNRSLHNMTCQNSLITGYSDDEMIGERPSDDSENEFNYHFNNCIIRTPKVDTDIEDHFVGVVYEDVEDTTHYGRKHFVNIDGDKQMYDFRLRGESGAIDVANPDTSSPIDRDGNNRDTKPDVGAYEFMKKE